MSWCCQNQRWMFSRWHGSFFGGRFCRGRPLRSAKHSTDPFPFWASHLLSFLPSFTSALSPTLKRYFEKCSKSHSMWRVVTSLHQKLKKCNLTDEDWWSTRQSLDNPEPPPISSSSVVNTAASLFQWERSCLALMSQNSPTHSCPSPEWWSWLSTILLDQRTETMVLLVLCSFIATFYRLFAQPMLVSDIGILLVPIKRHVNPPLLLKPNISFDWIYMPYL